MTRRLVLTSLSALLLCATASAGNFSVSGPGGAIPDCPDSPGAWNAAPTWGVFTSTVNVLNPVNSITKVTLTGLTHTFRGDVQAFLTDPAGVRHNVVVRPGFTGANSGDGGDYLAGNYAFVQSGGGTVAQGGTNINGGTYNQYLNAGAGMWTSGTYVINNTALNSIAGPAGTWTLTVVDWFNADTGSLTGWTLEGTDTPDPGMMYWVSNDFSVHRANLDGTANVSLGTTFKTPDGRVALDLQGGKMYWASAATNTIHRANLDGSNEQDLLVGSVSGTELISLDLQGGKMYWSDGATNSIHRANLDGSNDQDLLTGFTSGARVSLDVPSGKMHWASAATNTIHRANLDGSSPQDLLVGSVLGTELISLDLSGGKMYWPDAGTNSIRRANLDGTGPQNLGGFATICPGFPNFEASKVSLDVPGGKMYWADGATNTIHRANLDGSSPQDLLLGSVQGTELISLDLQGGKMYWVDGGTNSIRRANLDGSSPQNLGISVFSMCGTDISLALPGATTMVQSCFPGTNGVIACPCGQPANPDGGCANFGAGPTTGARLSATGTPSVSADTVLLITSNHRSPAIGVLNVFFSFKPGSATPTLGNPSGAGVRCIGTGGDLRRLYTTQVFGGTGAKPGMGDLSVSARSASFPNNNHTISPGETRHYFNVYRDGQAGAPANCNDPLTTTNVTNGGAIAWGP